MDCCECGDEPSGFRKGGEFADYIKRNRGTAPLKNERSLLLRQEFYKCRLLDLEFNIAKKKSAYINLQK
jgi:hypothetical protein